MWSMVACWLSERMLHMLLGYIRCDGFFEDASASFFGGGSNSCLLAIGTSEWTSFDPS